MQQRLYTIAEIAQQLNIPESTARFYRDKFNKFIPSVGTGRNRRYKEEAAEALRIIAEGLRNRLTATEIAEQLSCEFPITVEVERKPQQQTAAVAQTATAAEITFQVDLIKHILEMQRDQEREITELRFKYVAQGELLEELQNQNAKQQELIQQLQEKNLELSEEQVAAREEIREVKTELHDWGQVIRQREEDTQKPFWKRWFFSK